MSNLLKLVKDLAENGIINGKPIKPGGGQFATAKRYKSYLQRLDKEIREKAQRVLEEVDDE